MMLNFKVEIREHIIHWRVTYRTIMGITQMCLIVIPRAVIPTILGLRIVAKSYLNLFTGPTLFATAMG